MQTPAFLIDTHQCIARLKLFTDLRQETRFKLLYSIKSLSEPALLESMLPYLDGFCVSSAHEAKLVRDLINAHAADGKHEVHLSTPGLREDQLNELVRDCDVINFNSETQRARFASGLIEQVGLGLRLNPERSFLEDDRYDPCRPFSKLGVPLDRVGALTGISGVHFHTMFNGENIAPLIETLKIITASLGDQLISLDWINLGGGYVFTEKKQLSEFEALVSDLIDKYDLTVYFEPGKGIVDHAGSLHTRVIDLFERNGKNIAVLDTSVVHLPEVFEYQTSPKIQQANNNGTWQCILAGCSCKSGDVFGEYRFEEPLHIGSEVVIKEVGAYSIVKASRFNGIALPEIIVI